MLSVTNKSIMLNVIMVSVVMLNVIMLSAVMLNDMMLIIIMLNVSMLFIVMLNIVAPQGSQGKYSVAAIAVGFT